MSGELKDRIMLVIRKPIGGILSYIKYIYSQSCFDQYDFTVIVPEPELFSVFDKIFHHRNMEFIVCDTNKDTVINAWIYLRHKKVNLIHSHGFTSGSLLALVARLYRIPHLMTAHDVFLEKQFQGLKGTLVKSMLPYIFNRIDKIHAVSMDASDNLGSFFPDVDKGNIVVIPNGIDVDQFSDAKKKDFSDQCSSADIFLIGFFGRFMSQKGFRYLVDAIEILLNNALTELMPLVLTFGWGGFIREDYQDIENRGLKDYFKMLPHTDNVASAIKGVDLVAMPSLWEACGLLGMEALVAGVPIIGTSCIGLREVLHGSPAVTVAPGDGYGLAVAIADEMNHSRKAEFEAYVPIAKERFTLDKPSQELKKLYDQMTMSK